MRHQRVGRLYRNGQKNKVDVRLFHNRETQDKDWKDPGVPALPPSISPEKDEERTKRQRANLKKADKAQRLGAKLMDAHLYGTNLANGHLVGADFRGAQLEGADLRSMDLHFTKFGIIVSHPLF